MKYILLVLLASINVNAENCKTEDKVVSQDVVYTVDAKIPEHLKGATITITKVDGTSSTVKAEQFMVVQRKQKTVVGKNLATSRIMTCQAKQNKNLLMLEGRKDITDLETTANGKTLNTVSNKEFIPGVNYFRRQLIKEVGAGAGVDSNGTLKGIIGIEF